MIALIILMHLVVALIQIEAMGEANVAVANSLFSAAQQVLDALVTVIEWS